MNIHATQVIEALGGTAEVARIFNISMPSVSAWKAEGIPEARVMYLRVAKKKELSGFDLEAATADRNRSTAEPAAEQGVQ